MHLQPGEEAKWGMCMALQLFHVASVGLCVVAGYEDGTAAFWRLDSPTQPTCSARLHEEPVMALAIDSCCTGEWQALQGLHFVYLGASCATLCPWHEGPARHEARSIALCIADAGVCHELKGHVHCGFSPASGVFAGGVSGAADDKVVFFCIDWELPALCMRKSLQVKQQGIADLAIRNDGRVTASAGWDSKVRVMDYRKAKALAILRYEVSQLFLTDGQGFASMNYEHCLSAAVSTDCSCQHLEPLERCQLGSSNAPSDRHATDPFCVQVSQGGRNLCLLARTRWTSGVCLA